MPARRARSGRVVKLDGFRMAARIDHGRAHLLTRTGLAGSDKYPSAFAALAKMRAKGPYPDGELCGVGAVRLLSVATPLGDVALPGGPIMMCGFAWQFSGWVHEVAGPLTFAYTGRRLTSIETVSAFACRARVDKPGMVPSEHARGDAVDVAAFVLADRSRIGVREEGAEVPPARDLVHALRMSACGYFTTVLGPGANPDHADHLHFDSGLHGSTPNYRICE